jgi:serine/threonine protein phosphatase PrpC
MSESNSPKGGSLWARLFSAQEAEETPAEQPVRVEPPAHQEPAPVALAEVPVETPPSNGAALPVVIEEPAPTIEAEAPAEVAPPTIEMPPVVEAPPAPPLLCLACGTPRKAGLEFCHDCGWLFPVGGAAASPVASSSLRDAAMPATTNARLNNRFEVGELICDRQGVLRHRGVDQTNGHPVVIVSSPAPAAVVVVAEAMPVALVAEDEIMPGFDDDIPVAMAVPLGSEEPWPSIAWEKSLLETANHPALPAVLDQFTENNTEYLVLEWPLGLSLWDAWDEPEADAGVRYTWLQKIAAGMQALHQAGAIFEGIRPDVVVIGAGGQPRITDLADVLPLPLPPNAPIKATLYTSPELILSPHTADARSDLYSFGALLYSLEYLHHPLEEKDFEKPYMPLQITERFPDVHPLFLRIINKTFCRDLNTRFPTDEMTKTDPSGFSELIKTLAICGRAFDDVRLDIAAWTTTGMVRTGNEDALTVLHGVDTRQDNLGEYAMILLCDGMGGYEAGELAAALAIDEMRKFLLAQPIFAALTGREGPKESFDSKKYQEIMRDALKHANKEVYTASRTPGKGKRGMGCTAECVYIDSRNVIAGHVGDSRVYHLHRGRLIQLTRDQTLVNRLVELGQLTAAEAEDHPRKNELQQAIGGQPDVVPGTYAGKLMRGDWVLVCSDGLTNHIGNKELETMLTREAANSAEEAARRLLNLVNLRGATDNATIVVVRAS